MKVVARWGGSGQDSSVREAPNTSDCKPGESETFCMIFCLLLRFTDEVVGLSVRCKRNIYGG